ncbi:hypothetical protein OB2597_00550 [Pseudooceanicola batsensis HTCC2597]|uniref:Sulfotransferase family protein n=1 Tax=Pseudooceanicola batsensis (strain ATCC BAA-863 / DSM 15984 / KCTC 12145 / HTCC2597) TaxID=252305 RepID=A3U1S7_PSEBH|nr:hypothetical protein [Pseudooceanicola batsensis]EAQ01861.1 hypothetical protein OB2597_00550 [Pseudooceanicola batsensis HTCC2597]
MSGAARVVNLGLPKSGTTTLGRALRRSGMTTADHRIQDRQATAQASAGAYVADLLYAGYFGSGDPLEKLAGFDALSEISVLRERQPAWPQMDHGIISAIRDRHPEVYFVASWRDPREISESMLNWTNMVARMERAALPGLPVGYGAGEAERIRWIEAHYAFLETVMSGDRRFLILDVAAPDARERLAGFLGRDLPWWGQANRNPRAKASRDGATAG